MLKKLAFVVLFFILTSPIFAKSDIRTHDLTGGFLSYWNSVKNLDLEQKIKRFHAEVVPLFPEYYESIFDGWWKDKLKNDSSLQKLTQSNPKLEVSLRETAINDRLGEILADFPKMETSFAERSARLQTELASGIESFKLRFPDFDDRIDAYVIHSLYKMDGGTRRIHGKTYFIFGVDGILKFHGAETDVPFFHHELFHMYQRQFVESGDHLYETLWNEGMATYVSSVLNPSANWKSLLLDTPEALVAQCDQDLEYLLRDMLSKLDSISENDDASYFQLKSTTPKIPVRAGYYIGYLVSKEMNKTVPLKDMIQLKGEPLRGKIKETLNALLSKVKKHELKDHR